MVVTRTTSSSLTIIGRGWFGLRRSLGCGEGLGAAGPWLRVTLPARVTADHTADPRQRQYQTNFFVQNQG